ncbi:MAG: YdeI/OmpD-associated family protein [Candidatus Saccharibacteria bacterium]
MIAQVITTGVVHKVPADLRQALLADESTLKRWNDLTPLARNEWICWCITVKQQKTRDEHVTRTTKQLMAGKRRPCCWVGCLHRPGKKPYLPSN